jgi:hypothetical protein
MTGRAIVLLMVNGVALCYELQSASQCLDAQELSPVDNAEVHAQQSARHLDAPLLFVKRHSYSGIHIYDTYYKWPPGGGGIYVLENPAAPVNEQVIRPIIDPTTPGTLGMGVYTHPELSWDATKLLFCFKGEPEGSTSIYEIGIDGSGLRRVTDPTPTLAVYQGRHGGQHDVAPAYLPNGRIVFLSTRASGLVPCNNTGVAILHVMNADGSNIRPISVNNVNEFDPTVMPDGRVLFGRWEYVDKNALTIQSLWTTHPDGTEETSLYANNMVFPEAILDARPVPGSSKVVATLAKHNGVPRGSVALIDPRLGKNNPDAITNLDHPDDPTHDTGDSCEPWPLSEDVVLLSGKPVGQSHNVIELVQRDGQRTVVLADGQMDLHSPMLIKPRMCPPRLPDAVDHQSHSGRFFVQDIYRGLPKVNRGEVKWLRVIEETSRVSASPGSPNPYNQTFLVSAALTFSVKKFLGVVPVDKNGSVLFEVPSGRAVYFQALDAEHRLIQSMRTFVQAAPGTTRSCIGCHEYNTNNPAELAEIHATGQQYATPLVPESWGSGFLDYPSMVQPIFNRRCVRCHGGTQGIAAGIDLSGGWTEHFNISYENLVSRRETQLIAYWIAGIDCMNGTALWSSQLFPPRSHGSGAAPLADLLVEGHNGQIPDLTSAERDLIMAWIDTNGLYHGTWNYTEHGYTNLQWNNTKEALTSEMRTAGCMKCHGNRKQEENDDLDEEVKVVVNEDDNANEQVENFENDWINLERPELSRILRAPLARGSEGFGLGLCRDHRPDSQQRRIRLLWDGYAHAVKPISQFAHQSIARPLSSNLAEGRPVLSFDSTCDIHYQKMLGIIDAARRQVLATPRIDMPGAVAQGGACRQFGDIEPK